MSVIPLQYDDDRLYPESDGEPMAETDLHRDELIALIQALQRRYEAEADVYVTGNLFLYYRERDPKAVLSPDVCVIRGGAKERRRKYLLWKEGRPPAMVIELTSDSTRRRDLVDKKKIYAEIGVEEYFLHDPYVEYLTPPLQGFRLVENQYLPIPREIDGSLTSRTTGLKLRREGDRLRLLDATTGRPLLWPEELEREAARAADLEEEVARLRRELERRERAEGS
jgi:Uma2 family endonuclease